MDKETTRLSLDSGLSAVGHANGNTAWRECGRRGLDAWSEFKHGAPLASRDQAGTGLHGAAQC